MLSVLKFQHFDNNLLLLKASSSNLRWLDLTHRQVLPFALLLMSSPLTKIVIIYTQILLEENIFPKIPMLHMLKNAQKFKWKTWSKISFDYTWLIYRENCPSWLYFVGNFWSGSKLSRRSITAAKRWEITKEEKWKAKTKRDNNEKPQDVGHFSCPKILISAHAWARMPRNAILVERKVCCHVANAFLSRLHLQVI